MHKTLSPPQGPYYLIHLPICNSRSLLAVCSINHDIFLFCLICQVTMFLMLYEVWAIKLTQTLEPTDRPNKQPEHRIGCMQIGGQNTNNFPLMMWLSLASNSRSLYLSFASGHQSPREAFWVISETRPEGWVSLTLRNGEKPSRGREQGIRRAERKESVCFEHWIEKVRV